MKPVTLLAGSDHYEVQKAALALAQKLTPEDPLNFEVLNAQVDHVDAALAQIASLREAVLTLPFLGGGKLVWWKNVTFLADTVLGRNASVLEALEQLLPVFQQVDGTSVTLVISALGVDKRRKFVKELGKVADVRTFDLPDARRLDPAEVVETIEGQLARRGLRAESGVADRLFQAFGADKRGLEEAVEKLHVFVGGPGEITLAQTRDLVGGNRETVIWDFCDAVLSGKPKAALIELEQLFRQGESEIGILILLAMQVRMAALGGVLLEHKLMRIVQKGSFTSAEIDAKAEACLPRKKSGEAVSTFQIGQVCQKSRRRPAAFWMEALEILHRTNKQIVTGAADKQRALELAVLQITG